MDDPVDASLGGGAGRGRPARVDGDARVPPVRFLDHGADLRAGERLHVARSAVGQLDEVHAVLALPAYFRDHLRRGVAEHADAVFGRADPRRLVVLDAAIRDDHAAGAVHARPFQHAELDGIAHTHVREPGAAGHADARHAGAQHLLGAPRRLERPELRPRRASTSALPAKMGVAVGEMRVSVDQPRHDPLTGGVDDVDVPVVLELDRGGQPPDARDAIALHHERLVGGRRTPRAVDQGAVTNDERLYRAVHLASLIHR